MNDIVPVQPPQEAEGFLQAAALDAVTALATVMSEPAKLAHSAVRLIRAFKRKQFLHQLAVEWAELKVEGHIEADYGATDQCQAELADLLESLEDANFDQEQLDLLRKLFLASASEQLTDRSSPLPREYLAIGRALAAGEVEVLAQTYRYLTDWRALPVNNRPTDAGSWMKLMTERTRLKHEALISMHESKLIEKGLMTDRLHGDRSGIRTTPDRYRLTDLGFAFCEFLASYDTIKS